MLENIPNLITEEGNCLLAQAIEEAKVQATIWSLGPDKALDLDKFPISFFLECFIIPKILYIWVGVQTPPSWP
jgi:hypothetical protein